MVFLQSHIFAKSDLFWSVFSLTLITTFEIQGSVWCTSVVQDGWKQVARLPSFGFGLELVLSVSMSE